RDPAWVADGVISERWAPASPVTGRLDAFEWKAPVERLGQLIEQEEDAEQRIAAPPAIVAPVAAISPPEPAPAPTPPPAVAHPVEALPEGESRAPAPPVAAVVVEEAAARAPAIEDAEVEAAEQMPLPDDPGVDPE